MREIHRMTRLMHLTIVSVIAVGALLATAQPAAAQWRWRRTRAARTNQPAVVAPTRPGTAVYGYRRPYPADYYYPKYTGAFHARYFDGIPSIYGTRPVRGTAW